MHQLERVDRDVYRPVMRGIEGSEPILSHLRQSSPDPSLRDATMQLMKAARDQEGSYEWSGTEWVPTQFSSAFEPAESDVASASSLLKELRAELLMLRGAHGTLKERVAEVERRITGAEGPKEAEPQEKGTAEAAEPPAPQGEREPGS